MNEWLAFYCDRDRTPGHLYTRAASEPGGQTLYQVWSRAPLVDGLPAAADTPTTTAALRTALTAGGGLIAATQSGEGGTRLHLETVPGPGYDPAAAVLCLRPGLEPQWTALAQGRLALGPADLSGGALVLAPATRSDQSGLEGFLVHLRGLPDDYRSLVLNVLRRPGIEAALWRLERRLADLARPPATPGPDPTVTGPWPWVLAGLLVIELGATLGAAWWLKASATNRVTLGEVRLEWPAAPAPALAPAPERHPARATDPQPR